MHNHITFEQSDYTGKTNTMKRSIIPLSEQKKNLENKNRV